MSDAAGARIHDRGYRRYDGPRLGPAHAVRSLALHSFRRIVGLRRPARAKVLPVLGAVIAYLPATVFVGLAAFFPDFAGALPTYSGYYGFVSAAILLFVAFAAPEALTADRRSKTLSLYLAAPLTRTTYLAAQAAAIALALAVVTLGPLLLLLVGLVLQGAGPHGAGELVATLARILVSGALVTAYYTALATAVASRTDRRGVASAGIIGLVIGSDALVDNLVRTGRLPAEGMALSLGTLPYEVVQRIYGDPGAFPEASTAVLAAAVVGWTALAALAAWATYQRLQVTR